MVTQIILYLLSWIWPSKEWLLVKKYVFLLRVQVVCWRILSITVVFIVQLSNTYSKRLLQITSLDKEPYGHWINAQWQSYFRINNQLWWGTTVFLVSENGVWRILTTVLSYLLYNSLITILTVHFQVTLSTHNSTASESMHNDKIIVVLITHFDKAPTPQNLFMKWMMYWGMGRSGKALQWRKLNATGSTVVFSWQNRKH